MLEILIVLVAVLIFQIFRLGRTLSVIPKLMAEIATNPIRHHVNVSSDIANLSEKFDSLERVLDDIDREITGLRRNFVTDEMMTEMWLESVTKYAEKKAEK